MTVMPTLTLNIPSDLAYLALRTASARFKKAPAELNDSELAATIIHAQQQFELENQILNTSEASSIAISQQQFDDAFEHIQKRYEDEDSFHTDLARNGMNVEDLQRAIWRELRVEATLERVGARAADINDIDVKIYYYMHLDRFDQPETRTARHILLTINPEYAENTREAAYQRIQQIRKRLEKKPQRFEEQAMKHSECPTSLQGGLLGRLPRGQLYPSLETALFALKEGGLSEIVESELGFHLLLCEKIQNAGPASLEEAYPRILESLQKRRRRICQKGWLTQIQTQNQTNQAKESA